MYNYLNMSCIEIFLDEIFSSAKQKKRMKHPYHRILIVVILLTVSCLLLSSCEESTTNPAPVPRVNEILFVANLNENVGSLSQMTIGPDQIRIDLVQLGLFPSEIIQFEDRLYVINEGSAEMNVLGVLENNDVEIIDNISLDWLESPRPRFADVTAAGKFFISDYSNRLVTVLDLNSGVIQAFLPVGQSPLDVEIVGDKVYVCNSGLTQDDVFLPGTVTVLSALTNSVVKTIEVKTNPRFMAVDLTGRLHVVCTGNYGNIEGEIVVVNTAVDTVEQYIPIGGQPGDIAMTSNGVAYVTGGGWANEPGKLFRYNSATGEILNGSGNPIEVGTGAARIAINYDDEVFVACETSERVDKVVVDERVDSFQIGNSPRAILIYTR